MYLELPVELWISEIACFVSCDKYFKYNPAVVVLMSAQFVGSIAFKALLPLGNSPAKLADSEPSSAILQ
jgi:hypothetical protein